MQPTPDLTLNTNSYVDMVTANDYFTNRLGGGAWFSACQTDTYRALITASERISMLVKTDYKLPITITVTDNLKKATYELALAMIVNQKVVTQKNTSSNVKRVGAGSAKVEFFAPVKGTVLPSLVNEYLRNGDLLESVSSSVNKVFGTNGVSTLTTPDCTNLSQGFGQ